MTLLRLTRKRAERGVLIILALVLLLLIGLFARTAFQIAALRRYVAAALAVPVSQTHVADFSPGGTHYVTAVAADGRRLLRLQTMENRIAVVELPGDSSLQVRGEGPVVDSHQAAKIAVEIVKRVLTPSGVHLVSSGTVEGVDDATVRRTFRVLVAVEPVIRAPYALPLYEVTVREDGSVTTIIGRSAGWRPGGGAT